MTINGNDVHMIRGDTEQLVVTCQFSDGTERPFEAGDTVTLTVAALYAEWTEGAYQVGDIRLAWYGGAHQLWKCRQAHDTATYPDITPDGTAWRTFWIPFHGTSPETAQDWIAPSGAHDQYEPGEYMIWNGQTYKCLSATVYTPEEYAQAWEVV